MPGSGSRSSLRPSYSHVSRVTTVGIQTGTATVPIVVNLTQCAASGAYCWGDNTVGALGIGAVGGTVNIPTAVVGTAGLAMTSLTTNGDTLQANAMCYITPSDVTYCAGSDANGQLGAAAPSRVKKAPPKVKKK
jgi:hypothetical protein